MWGVRLRRPHRRPVGTFLDDDPKIDAFGEDLDFPLALDGNGDLRAIRGEDNVLSAMITRAMTAAGEVSIYPSDGADLEDLQGGPADLVARAALEARLLEQYTRDDRLASVTVTSDDGADPGDTTIHLSAELRTGTRLEADVPFGS